MNKPHASRMIYWAVLALLFLPLVILITYSFNSSKSSSLKNFSTKWYEVLFTPEPQLSAFAKDGYLIVKDEAGNPKLDGAGKVVTDRRFHKNDWNGVDNLWSAFRNSLLYALISGFLATVIGTLGAIALAWYRFKTKSLLQAISFLPLVLPEVVLGVSLMIIFTSVLFIPLGPFTVLIAHTTFCLPFVLLIVSARLAEFDFSIIEAARDLGAGEIQILWKVIIPIAVPGIVGGFLTAFTLSLEDFVVTFFVNGPGELSQTLPMYLWGSLKRGIAPAPYINAFTTLLIFATMTLVIVFRRFLKYFVK